MPTRGFVGNHAVGMSPVDRGGEREKIMGKRFLVTANGLKDLLGQRHGAYAVSVPVLLKR